MRDGDKDDKRKKEAPLGTGMAEGARSTIKAMPAYRDYQLMKMSSGGTPVPFEERKKGNR